MRTRPGRMLKRPNRVKAYETFYKKGNVMI